MVTKMGEKLAIKPVCRVDVGKLRLPPRRFRSRLSDYAVWMANGTRKQQHTLYIHSARSCEHVLQHQLFNYWGRGRFVNATLHGRAKICNKGGLVYCYSINRFRENVCRQGNIITSHSYVPVDNVNPLPFNRFNN